MTRPLRLVALLAVLVAAAGLLTACQKPLPEITVLAAKTSYTVTPAKYCGYDRSKCRRSTDAHLTVVTANVAEKILIDVPRRVADAGWLITALSLDLSKNLGSTNRIDGSHTYPFPANENGGSPYIVQVRELHDGAPNGSLWTFVVQLSATKQ